MRGNENYLYTSGLLVTTSLHSESEGPKRVGTEYVFVPESVNCDVALFCTTPVTLVAMTALIRGFDKSLQDSIATAMGPRVIFLQRFGIVSFASGRGRFVRAETAPS